MEWPKELFIHIFILANDVEITKMLRSVCRLSLAASFDYFNILLKTDVKIYYDSGQWSANEKSSIKRIHYHNPIGKSIEFHITVKNLFDSVEASGSKKVNFNYC